MSHYNNQGIVPVCSSLYVLSLWLTLCCSLCKLGEGLSEALDPVHPGVMVPEQVHRVGHVLGRVHQQGTVDKLGLEPVYLKMVNLQATVL